MVKPIIAVAGVGPGIGTAVAEKFGSEGYAVALIARTPEKLEAVAEGLRAKGIEAVAFPTDLTDWDALAKLFTDIKAKFGGPISVFHFNQYVHIFKSLFDYTKEEIELQFGSLAALVRAIQLVVPQLEEAAAAGQKAALSFTGGGSAFTEKAEIQQLASQWGAEVLAVTSVTKHSLTATLRHTLAPKKVKVTEVIVTGAVKGTVFDDGHAKIEPGAVAQLVWEQATTDTGDNWYAVI